MKVRYTIVFVFMAGLASAMSIDTFSLHVGNDTISQGDLLEVKILLENMEGQIKRPDFTGFEIVGGPNQSSSFQFINGRSTSSISHSYWLRAREVGVVYLGPVYAVAGDGLTMQCAPIEITVMPASDRDPIEHRVGDQATQHNLLWQEAPPKRKLKTRKI